MQHPTGPTPTGFCCCTALLCYHCTAVALPLYYCRVVLLYIVHAVPPYRRIATLNWRGHRKALADRYGRTKATCVQQQLGPCQVHVPTRASMKPSPFTSAASIQNACPHCVVTSCRVKDTELEACRTSTSRNTTTSAAQVTGTDRRRDSDVVIDCCSVVRRGRGSERWAAGGVRWSRCDSSNKCKLRNTWQRRKSQCQSATWSVQRAVMLLRPLACVF